MERDCTLRRRTGFMAFETRRGSGILSPVCANRDGGRGSDWGCGTFVWFSLDHPRAVTRPITSDSVSGAILLNES